MTIDPKIDEIKQKLDQVVADDAAEDSAYEQQIVTIQEQLTQITAERDRLLLERAVTLTELIATRDSLQFQINSLNTRITALGV